MKSYCVIIGLFVVVVLCWLSCFFYVQNNSVPKLYHCSAVFFVLVNGILLRFVNSTVQPTGSVIQIIIKKKKKLNVKRR